MAYGVDRNAEGYKDPTAEVAITRTDEEKQRIDRLMYVLKYIIRQSGFELVDRVQLRDRRSGKVYK